MTLTKNFILSSFGELSLRGSKFLLLIFLARYIGNESYGLFNVSLSFCTIFIFVLDFGMVQYSLKYINENAYDIKNIFETKILVSLFYFLIILVSCVIFKFNNEKFLFIILICIYLIFNDLSLFISIKYRYQNKFINEAYLRIIMGILQLFIPILLFSIFKSVIYIFIGLIFSSFLTLIPFALEYKSQFSIVFSLRSIMHILNNCYPLVFSIFLISIIYNMDLFFLGFFDTLENISWYSTISKIIFGIILVPMQLFQVVSFSFVSNNLRNNQNFIIFFRDCYRINILLGLVMSTLAFFMKPYFLFFFNISDSEIITKIYYLYLLVALAIYICTPLFQIFFLRGFQNISILIISFITLIFVFIIYYFASLLDYSSIVLSLLIFHLTLFFSHFIYLKYKIPLRLLF